MHHHPDAKAVVRALAPDEPVICNRPHAAARAARFFAEKFPGKSMYAVKANPSPELLRILWDSGFELLDFRELFAPDDAPDHEYYDTVPAEWAKRWPDEEIWRLRLRRR